MERQREPTQKCPENAIPGSGLTQIINLVQSASGWRVPSRISITRFVRWVQAAVLARQGVQCSHTRPALVICARETSQFSQPPERIRRLYPDHDQLLAIKAIWNVHYSAQSKKNIITLNLILSDVIYNTFCWLYIQFMQLYRLEYVERSSAVDEIDNLACYMQSTYMGPQFWHWSICTDLTSVKPGPRNWPTILQILGIMLWLHSISGTEPSWFIQIAPIEKSKLICLYFSRSKEMKGSLQIIG